MECNTLNSSKVDYAKMCYNHKCSHCLESNQCWYNESVCLSCTGRIANERRKTIRNAINYDRVKRMNIDEMAELLFEFNQTDCVNSASDIKVWLEAVCEEGQKERRVNGTKI